MTDTPLPAPLEAHGHRAALGLRRRDIGLAWLACLVTGAAAQAVQPFGMGTAGAAIAGLAAPLLLRHGHILWPGVWLGAFPLAMAGGFSITVALLLASIVTALGHGGATLLRRLGVRRSLARRHDATAYLAVALGVALLAAGATSVLAWLEGLDRQGGLLLRALSAACASGAVLGAALIGLDAVVLAKLRRPGTAAAAAGALAVAVATPWLPEAATLFGVWCVGGLLVVVARLAGATPAMAAGSIALAALAATFQTLAVPGAAPSWQPALVALTAAVTWSAAALFAAVGLGEARSREARWARTLETAQVGSMTLDMRRGRIDLSPRWQDWLGAAAVPARPDDFWPMVHPDDLPALRAMLMPAPRSERALVPVMARVRSGTLEWRQLRIACLDVTVDAHGHATHVKAIAQDVTDATRALERARVAERVYDQLAEGLLVTDAQGRVIHANARYAEITGERPEALVGTIPRLLRSALTSAATDADATMRNAGHWHGEVVDRRANGELCTLALDVTQVRDDAGQVTHHAVLVTDLTLAREHHAELARKALTDDLTGLPNRLRLVQALEAAMADCERSGESLTVCSLDLDHFKALNDRLGTEASDRLLVEIGRRLSASLGTPEAGMVARVGGDEFMLLLRTADAQDSVQAVQRLLDRIAEPFGSDGVEPIVLTASIGATVFPKDRADAETLLRHAGHALWGVKQAGRNGYLFFDAERQRRAEARFSALGRLQEAFDADEFTLHFQPKVDMRRGKVLGAEALLRWTHPEQGIVPPGQFLPIIENTPLAVDVGTWVLRKGVEQLAQWHKQGLDLSLSVNVSARLLQEPMFGKYVAGLLQRHRVPLGRRLILEVLETAALKDMERTRQLMDECRELGVRFALDDFGTGFSNLSYLRELPVDILKIDRSFVADMLDDKEDLAIVEGVLNLARTFGCAVVAEGVETPEQARRLIRMGCDIGQGNGIAAAMPLDRMVAWAAEFKGMEGLIEPSFDIV